LKRVFFDANVLFTAAHNPAGKAKLVIEFGGKGYWEIVTNTLAVEEARRNLALKFPDCLTKFEILLSGISVFPSRIEGSCSFSLSSQDRIIFLSALKCKATHLLTGDIKHFGPFMNKPNLTSGIIIQTVAEFLTRGQGVRIKE
jgi:predicted nucleic acid-binding protein